jgi:uncharacterized protein
MNTAGPFDNGRRYNAYGSFLRRRFGCRVHKVIVDAGFICPNRDGTVGLGGCTYCSNDSFRPGSVSQHLPVGEQVRRGIEYLTRRYGAGKFVVYFQPYSNTYRPLDQLIPLYEEALSAPDVVGLSVGTRPDCIDSAKIAWFERLARDRFVTIEYGLESVCDETLRRINRGHDVACWRTAVDLTRGRGIWLCAHLILGFPWETREQALSAAETLSEAGIDFLKLHHLHVVRGTKLAQEYLAGSFRAIDFEAYAQLVVDFLERLSPEIKIERLFGLAPGDQLIAPLWGRGKARMQQEIEAALQARATHQGRLRKAVSSAPTA